MRRRRRRGRGQGFSTLWVGEHVVMVGRGASRYPYAPDGHVAVPAEADWLHPMIALSFAAAATSVIRLATGVLLVPEHNPVTLAKRAASLDRLSHGRLVLGIGVGWSQDEFAALGIPFERRGARTDEYLAAMRTLWREDAASFTGEFVNFADIRVNPEPARDGRIPIIVGGNSDAARNGAPPGARMAVRLQPHRRRPRKRGDHPTPDVLRCRRARPGQNPR